MAVGVFGAAVLLAGARVARSQSDQAAPTDSLSALEKLAQQTSAGGVGQLPDTLAASPIGLRFEPTYLNQINGDVSILGMKNSFQTNIRAPFGSVFNFSVSKDEKHYRLQPKLDESKQLSAAWLHVFNLFTTGSISFLDSRIFNRSIIPGGATQDYILNDQSINGGAVYRRSHATNIPLVNGVTLDATVSGAAVESQRTYKDDQSLAAGGFGGVAARLFSKAVRVNARGGHRETWDKSETSIAQFDSLGSSEDSLSTGVFAVLGDSIFLDASYIYYNGDRTWADQAQGSLGGQQSGVQYVFQETEQRNSDGAVIALNAKVWDHFRVNVTANHESQLYNYAIQTTRYSNTVANGLLGTFSYTAPWKTTSLVTLENRNTLRDFGPQSVSSYNDIRKKAGMALSHQFGVTFRVDLAGSTQLTRTEYLDPEANPRDRDQIDTSVNLRFSSKPFPDMLASVSLAYSASEYINIDASQSNNNRTRDLYELRPGFTFAVTDHFVITQSYGLSIEYTDYIYTPTSNYLDRNLIFSNRFDFRPTKRVGIVLDYAYNFHDNGSYLPNDETGQEELSVQGEDRRDRVSLRMDYKAMTRVKQLSETEQLTDQITVFAEQRYSVFEDRSLLTDTSTETKDGQISVGTRGEYAWGAGRILKFSLARVKRFNKFGSEAEKDYWDIRSEFNYPF